MRTRRYLTGNPCWKFEGYRDYVTAILPQVDILDGQIVSPCDKITAKQNYAKLRSLIEKQQNDYQGTTNYCY